MLLFLPCTALFLPPFSTYYFPLFAFAVKRRTNFVVVVTFHVEIPAEMPKQLPGLIAQSDNSWQLPIGSKVENGMAKMPHCAGVRAESQLCWMALIKHRPNWPWSDSKRERERGRERECESEANQQVRSGGVYTEPTPSTANRVYRANNMWPDLDGQMNRDYQSRAKKRTRERERKWQLEPVVRRLSVFTVGSR